VVLALFTIALVAAPTVLWAAPPRQDQNGAGTVEGKVTDQFGGVMVSIPVEISNKVSGFKKTTTTDDAGHFVFRNLPINPYQIAITVPAFKPFVLNVDVRSGVLQDLKTLTLQLAGAVATAEVKASGGDLVELSPTAHTDIDQSRVARLPVETQSGLNQAITLAAPGIVADSNGFFHPIGDHAQTQIAIDNQPVTDQQSRLYSNQISPAAVQSMEVITGVPPAEYGDKSSLVVQIVTKSGLDQKRSGDMSTSFGSFNTPTGEFNLGMGSSTFGNFMSMTGMRSDRYLDSPEFAVSHGAGHTNSVFDRLDWRSDKAGALHINIQGAQSSFQVPNTLDQDALGQDQHQKINSFNFAPGYSRILSHSAILTVNGYTRQDRVTYTGSADPFADQPATVGQSRRLTNGGFKMDIAYLHGAHNLKVGGSVGATWLTEHFTFGITDPTLNSPCVDAQGNPSDSTALTSTSQCAAVQLMPNDAFSSGLLPYDLSRSGTLFPFNDTGTIKTQAFYIQDEIRAGPATFSLGLRADHYAGLTSKGLLEPRLGVALQSKHTGTILRASYGRTLETPYNENLLLSSATGVNGITDSGFSPETIPLQPGVRNQFEVGAQQGFGSWVVVDVGYFQKHTVNAYDFDVLFDTPIVFPISWAKSDISGITGKITLVQRHGFSAFTVLGHNVARFFNPENGGLLFDSPLPDGVFRIDHDQKFQQTTNLQYEFSQAHHAWVGFTWRYDSGLVAGAVTDYATALTLTADQQAQIGLYCGSTFATPTAPISDCTSPNRGATRLVIPADGTENDDTNPPRIAPRSLFDLSIGVENLFRSKTAKVRLQLSVINLTNTVALYNFLSTFSGTHFVTPRAVRFVIGVTF
jgi:hypothetical protein